MDSSPPHTTPSRFERSGRKGEEKWSGENKGKRQDIIFIIRLSEPLNPEPDKKILHIQNYEQSLANIGIYFGAKKPSDFTLV